MPKRNLLLLFLVAAISLVACLAREQGRRVRGIAEVLGAIERSYLKPVDPRELETAAIEGIVARLDDQSRVIEGVERRDLEATLGQEFGGVGLELVAAGGGGVTVHAAIVGSPAWRAGIAAGDRIVEIDGVDARVMSVRDTVALLRGDVGSQVAIVVRGPAVGPGVDGGPAEEERSVTLVREEVRSESVLGDRRLSDGAWDWFVEGESGVALVRITSFGDRSAEELDAALTAIASHGEPRGLVIDLRGNPGGLLSAAVDVCDRFLDEGVIVSTRRRRVGQDDMTDVRRATAGAVLPGLPLAVLVDGLTASAAEIMAACLQDHGRAVVVGSRSFGKGTVQSLIPLSDGRRLFKLTTAEYLRPADTERQSAGAWGVAPDHGLEIDPTAQAREAYSQWRRRRDAARPEAAEPPQGSAGDLPRRMDPVLAKALDSLPPRAVDFRRKEKTSGDADEAGRAGAVAGRRDGGAG